MLCLFLVVHSRQGSAVQLPNHCRTQTQNPTARSSALKILILSPHRNDAAFSLSIAIHNWLAARHSITILNIFTRSRHAPYSDAAFVHDNDQLSYVSAMRLREDELFLRRITQDLPKGLKSHIHMLDLNLKDAPIRLRIAPEDACTTTHSSSDPAIEKIRRAISRQIEAGAMQALVIPAALGNHVDHLTVREAASLFTASAPAAFYEDLPYAANTADANTLCFATEERLTPVISRADAGIDRKLSLILGYASQVDSETASLISHFAARYNEGERLWANQAWTAIAEAEHLGTPQP